MFVLSESIIHPIMTNSENLRLNVPREGKGKSACFVPGGFRGVMSVEWSEILDWKLRFSEKSRRLAEEVLKRSDAPIKSIEWAKKILTK